MLISIGEEVKKEGVYMMNGAFNKEAFLEQSMLLMANEGPIINEQYVQSLSNLFDRFFPEGAGVSIFSFYTAKGDIFNAQTRFPLTPERTNGNWNLEKDNSLVEIASREENKDNIYLIPVIYAEQELEGKKGRTDINRIFVLNEDNITRRLNAEGKEESDKISRSMLMDPDPLNIDMSLVTKQNPIDAEGNRPYISSALLLPVWGDSRFIGLMLVGYRTTNCFAGASNLTAADTLAVKGMLKLLSKSIDI